MLESAQYREETTTARGKRRMEGNSIYLSGFLSLILRIGDFLCFAGTKFCDWKRLVFPAVD